MDGDGGLGDDWDDTAFINELLRVTDEAEVTLTTSAHAPASAPIPTHDPFAASPLRRFSPPPELFQRPPLPPPTTAASARDVLATVDDADRDFSPPRELFQRSVAEVGSSLTMVAASVSAGHCRHVGTGGGGVATKRDRDARELVRLKRKLDHVSKQMNELKNECTELRKDRRRKDLQIKAKEAEIQNLKKANVSNLPLSAYFCHRVLPSMDKAAARHMLQEREQSRSSKVFFSAGMDIDRSFHTPANGALHAGCSSRTSTRRTDQMNGKDKDVNSLGEDLYLKQGQHDLLEALELRHRTVIDNGISTSGVVSLEENTHFEPRNTTCKEIKAIGVQTDNTSDNEHECKKIMVERISSNLRAMWGMSGLISKINVSCSEEILSLLQCTRLPDNCEPSSEASSSMNEAISQVYDMFIKMNTGEVSIQTFLEALLNLCSFDNAAIVGRALGQKAGP